MNEKVVRLINLLENVSNQLETIEETLIKIKEYRGTNNPPELDQKLLKVGALKQKINVAKLNLTYSFI